jgi:acetylornithine aminotransferase
MAKGMGNGFPVGGLMIAPSIEPRIGMLGTTFGGAHLACAAALAVAEVTEREGLIAHAQALGERWIAQLRQVPGVVEVRGRGLMIGVQLEQASAPLRMRLLQEHRILVGSAGQKQSFRLLPSLALAQEDADRFTEVLAKELSLVHA